MKEFFTLEDIDQAANVVRSRMQIQPQVGMILGSGLGGLAESVDQPDIIPYTDIPSWPISTVSGHSGNMLIGKLEGLPVLVLQGRTHYYEGYSMAQLALPVRVMQRLEVTSLIVTNAAGGINPEFHPGELMLITDQINLLGMAGMNPLRGPNLDEIGPRFPDMSQPYDREYLKLARRVADEAGLYLREGVYAGLAGPSFESPAELRFLRTIGADAVGMSTVSEVITARHGGMRVLGISGISNKANLDGTSITTHEEVLAAGRLLAPLLIKLIRGFLRELSE